MSKNLDHATNSVNRFLSVSNETTNPAVNRFYPQAVKNWDDIKAIVTSRIWSPCTYNNNVRGKKNFAHCSFIVLDFDDGQWTLDSTIAFCQKHELSALVGTTRSHQKEKITKGGEISPPCDRFRLILTATEPCVNLRMYEYTMTKTMEQYPVDKSCKDGARMFFPCVEIVFTQLGGSLDWMVPPPVKVLTEAQVQAYQAQVRHMRESGKLPEWITRRLVNGAEPGRGRHAMSYAIGAGMTELGYSIDEIVSAIMRSPMSVIGEADVRRAVRNGSRKG